MSKEKLIILFLGFLSAMGMGIVLPVLPFYAASFGASPVTITLLFSVFSLCSFLSSPVLGSLSDKVGRRPMLLLNIASTALGWLVFALAGNIFFLFVGRIIDGLAAGNISLMQGTLSDIAATDKERVHSFGSLGAVTGIGYIMGPVFGGVLGALSPTSPFFFVFALSLFTLIVAWVFLPETNTARDRKRVIDLNPFAPLARAMRVRVLRPTLVAWFLFSLASASMQAILALYANTLFGIGSAAAGVIMGGIGLVIALNQMVGLKHFWLKRFSEPALELWMLAAMGVANLFLGVPLLLAFALGIILVTIGNSVLRVVVTSQVAGKVATSERGEMLGVLASLVPLSTIIASPLAGVAFDVHPAAPFVLGAVYSFAAFVVIIIWRRRFASTRLPEDAEMNAPL